MDHLHLRRSVAAAPAPGTRPLSLPANLGFEEGKPGSPPPGWFFAPPPDGRRLQAELTGERPKEGKQCAVLPAIPPGELSDSWFPNLMQAVDPAPELTPAMREQKALSLMLHGTPDSGGMRGLGQAQRTLSLKRVENRLEFPENRPPKLHELKPGVLYVDLTRLRDQDFKDALPRLAKGKDEQLEKALALLR
jgi:hypothetical protein